MGERAVGLMAQPQPSQLDRLLPSAPIARLADPLLAIGSSTLPWTGRQPEIAGDLTPIAEVLVERLVGQRRRKHRAQALEPKQEIAALCHLSGSGCQLRSSRRRRQRIKLLAHQHQPRVLAFELSLDPGRHRLALPIPLRRQPAQPVAPARVPHRHAQQPQQRLDPGGVSGLLLDQPVALATGAARVLLLRARHPHDPHHPWLTAAIRHQGPQHLLAIDPVGLRPPGPLIHHNARRIEHMVRDPCRQQETMQPKPVVASLVAAHHRRHRSQRPRRPLADALDQRQQASMIAALHLMARYPILVRAVYRHQPALSAQFDRNKNRAKIIPDGRAYGGCLHLTSPLVRVWKPKPSGCTPIAPWNLRCLTRNPS